MTGFIRYTKGLGGAHLASLWNTSHEPMFIFNHFHRSWLRIIFFKRTCDYNKRPVMKFNTVSFQILHETSLMHGGWSPLGYLFVLLTDIFTKYCTCKASGGRVDSKSQKASKLWISPWPKKIHDILVTPQDKPSLTHHENQGNPHASCLGQILQTSSLQNQIHQCSQLLLQVLLWNFGTLLVSVVLLYANP